MTTIGEGAFAKSGLTSIIIPNSVTTIEAVAFSNCTSLTSTTMPDGITNIGEYSFYGCTGLSSVTIPGAVTSIGYYAFAGCTGLRSITIPNLVMNIGEGAFADCKNIQNIYCMPVTPPSAVDNSFEGMNYNYCVLYVPKDSRMQYSFADGWRKFMKIEQMAEGGDKKDLIIKKKDGTFITIPLEEIEEITPVQERIIEKVVEVHDTIYVYDDSRSEIKLPIGETVELSISDGIITIKNAPMGTAIFVYDLEGYMVGKYDVKTKEQIIWLLRNNTYIIKIGEKTFKVRL